MDDKKVNDQGVYDFKPLRIIKRKDRLILAAVLLICAAVMAWLLLGKIQTTVDTMGLIDTGEDYCAVYQTNSGYISSIDVSTNSYVEKGDVIASVYKCKKGTTGISHEKAKAESVDIVAEESGYVWKVCVDPWQYVDMSSEIVRIMPEGKDGLKYVSTYVYSYEVASIEPGVTKAKVEITSMPEDVAGHANGTVVEVKRKPIDELYNTGHAENILTEYLQKNMDSFSNPYVAIVKLDSDPETGEVISNKGYIYDDLSPNIVCNVKLIVNEQRPIEHIFGIVR